MRWLALALLLSSASALADRPDTAATTLELVGMGIEVELPAMPGGEWDYQPRLAASSDWSPTAPYRAGSTLTVDRLFLRGGSRTLIDLQLVQSTSQCDAELRVHNRKHAQTRRGTISGWTVDRYPANPVPRIVGCKPIDPRHVAVASIAYRPASAGSGGAIAELSSSPPAIGEEQIQALLGALGRSFDDQRAVPSRPLEHPKLEAESTTLRAPLTTSAGLALDPSETGQLVARLAADEDRYIRLMPAYPEILFSVRVATAVPGNRACPSLLQALKKDPKTNAVTGQIIDAKELPRSYRNRKAIRRDRLLVVCEDFTGGLQLQITMSVDSSAGAGLTSITPVLGALHAAVLEKYGVEPKSSTSKAAASSDSPRVSRRARRLAKQREEAWLGSLLQLSVANVDGGEIPDPGYASELRYIYHMRFAGGPVGMFGHGVIDTGFGTSGGLIYQLHLDPYGLALGSGDHYLGISPGAGLSGWTGDRLDYAWQVGLRAMAVTTIGPVKVLAGARVTAVTGDDRQGGSDSAPFGDELSASADFVYVGDRGGSWGLGISYREARGAALLGAALTFGYGSP